MAFHARSPSPAKPRGLLPLWLVLALSLSTLVAPVAARAEGDCKDVGTNAQKLGVSRVVEIDATSGPVFGQMTLLRREAKFLRPHEVVLTFDDGPMPWITRSILATLERHCTRATFFNVGQMALAYPNVVREVLDRGHTVGTHTWSHPLNLKRLSLSGAEAEIEKGFAAVATAAGRPIAPFFRFPGLSDSTQMVGFLAERHVASFTVDVVSNDSYIGDAERLKRETLAKIAANDGGIILFHDIKAATARALPDILDALAARGYGVVHMVPKAPMQPKAELIATYEPQVARKLAELARTRHALVPFYGTTGPQKASAPASGAGVDTAKLDAVTARQTAGGTWSVRVKRGN